MYHFFWQIAQRWATRGIGFSPENRLFADSQARRRVRCSWSDLSHLDSTSLPYTYVLLSRLYGKQRQIGPARFAVVAFTVGMADVRSLTGKLRGWSHTQPVVCSLFLPSTTRCPLELYSVSIAYRGIREMHCIPHVSSHGIAASVGWKRSYHAFENFSLLYLWLVRYFITGGATKKERLVTGLDAKRYKNRRMNEGQSGNGIGEISFEKI